MATIRRVEHFPKPTFTREMVEGIRQRNLAHGAQSSEIAEAESELILTTIWPVIGG